MSIAADEVDLPFVVAEVRAEFERYETALLGNDIDALNNYFFAAPSTVRFGIAEHAFGIESVRLQRAGLPRTHPERKLMNTVINTVGVDVAVVSTEFAAPNTTRIGRQTQAWVRFAAGWKIIAAHVSQIDAPFASHHDSDA
jgi:hypothetical protein